MIHLEKPHTAKTLAEGLKRLGVPGADEKAEIMLAYMRAVLKRNAAVNLTAIKDESGFIDKHLLDSVAVYGMPEIEAAANVIDIGTGAGFPGVPLAVCYPDKTFLLIDSLGKRVDFIKETCAALGIANVKAMHIRAEDAARTDKRAAAPLRETFGLAVARAVAHLSVLCEYCLPLVKQGGAFYAYKTSGATKEIEESKTARRLLGAADKTETRDTPDQNDKNSKPSGHNIIVIKKENKSPKSYPRRPGTATKTPL